MEVTHLPTVDRQRVRPFIFNDFFNVTSTQVTPFTAALIASGTIGSTAIGEYDRNHPGVLRITSSTTANSGAFIGSNSGALLLGGGECAQAVWKPLVFASTTTRIGFHDATTSLDAVDGCYIEVDTSGIATGKTSNNSTRSTTSSTLQLTASTWYFFQVTLNNDASRALFEIYSDAGILLWSDTLTTNIPTAVGRETALGFTSTNAGTTATGIASLDLLAMTFKRSLVRGPA